MLDLHTNEHGYTEVNPPLLVRDHSDVWNSAITEIFDDQFDRFSRAREFSKLRRVMKSVLEGRWHNLPDTMLQHKNRTRV